MKKELISPIMIGLVIYLLIGCKSKEDRYTNIPQPLTNISFTPNNGGGYFLYTIPQDIDFLYAMAEYTLDNNTTVRKTSSVYSDTLFIEGLGTVKEYEVKLYSVNRTENKSQPVTVKITPLESNVNSVVQTLSAKAGFASIIIDWENPLQQKIDICVNIKSGEQEALKIHSSTSPKDRFSLDNLSYQPYELSVFIRDNYGNETKPIPLGEITPYQDGKLLKNSWSFLYDYLLYGDKWDAGIDPNPINQQPQKEYLHLYVSDSLKNAPEVCQESSIWKFWDDEIDDFDKLNLNYFITCYSNFPFSYFIDLGRTVQASRLKIWQRAWRDGNIDSYYAGQNVKTFEIWISDDSNPADGIFDGWEYVGRYTIVKPSDPVEAKNEAISGHHFILYPDNPHFTKPFRYLRFKGINTFDAGTTSGCSSEISLYGIEEDGSITPEMPEEK